MEQEEGLEGQVSEEGDAVAVGMSGGGQLPNPCWNARGFVLEIPLLLPFMLNKHAF